MSRDVASSYGGITSRQGVLLMLREGGIIAILIFAVSVRDSNITFIPPFQADRYPLVDATTIAVVLPIC